MKEAKSGSTKKATTKSAKPEPTKGVKKSTSRETKGPATKKSGSPIASSGRKADTPKPEAPASPPAAPVFTDQPELPATRGKLGVFGGPKDRGIKPDDKLALPTGPHGVYERVRSLNPKSFYCAMRWNYHVHHLTPEEVKRWWANKKLVITSVKNGNAIVARAVDYGPHENTGLAISVSPGAADALGVEPGDEVEIALADPKLPLGPT